MLESGQIVEYTELVPLSEIAAESIMDMEEDTQFIGMGVFHHRSMGGN